MKRLTNDLRPDGEEKEDLIFFKTYFTTGKAAR